MKTAHDLVLEAKQHIVEITLEEAQRQLALKPLLIDVREPQEYEAGHVPGAMNIPRGILEFMMTQDEALSDRQRAIILYCKTSGRAALSAQSLQKLGFAQIRSIAGGFDAWLAAGLPIDRPKPVSFE